ncbi:MAG: hypothetical protein K8I30_16125 [Anaerolineae bacterium]|nr:hypothetical protein [Anaerolineae bacterium]
MPRHYSLEEQQQILERLHANRGDVARTARELGISTTTLYRWRDSRKIPPSTFSTYSTNSTQPASTVHDSIAHEPVVSADSNNANPIPPDDLQALRDLKARMLELAQYIVSDDRIKQAIDAAPLKERIAAATQLIDRMIKLAAELPAEKEEDEIEEVILMYEGEIINDEEADYEDFDEEAAPESAGDFS